jgi:thiamine biosynthesis lipoprotein
MGTTVEAWCRSEPDERATIRLFEEVEEIASRFRPTSELVRVNADPGEQVQVSRTMGRLLRSAASVRELTGGLVDIGVGATVQAWGYDRSFSEITARPVAPEASQPSCWTFDPDADLISRAPGTKIDLGGIAKGWTADLAVESGRAVVVSAGGDIRSNHPDTAVPIEDPFGGFATTIALGVGALATSCTTKRSWMVGERRVSHLIDPRTGNPVRSPVVSASITAATALEAEAGAKASLLLGEEGLAWADACPWVRSAVVVWGNGSVFATEGTKVQV